MRISRPKKIVDPYDWLPGYGESNVAIVSEGLNLTIVVRYDREDPQSGEIYLAEREFRFEYAPAFLRQPFPGGFSFEVAGDATDLKLGVPIRPSESIAGASAKGGVKAGTDLPVNEDVADSCYFCGRRKT